MESGETLRKLVGGVRDTGVSYRRMAARAAERGHAISHAQLAGYAAGQVRAVPGLRMIGAVAAALDVPFERVRDAVVREYLDCEPVSPEDRVEIPVPSDLTAVERGGLRRVVEAWLAARAAAR